MNPFDQAWRLIKSGVPCLQCGRVYSPAEYEQTQQNWRQFVDEDGMTFDVCPSCVLENSFRMMNPQHVPTGVTINQEKDA